MTALSDPEKHRYSRHLLLEEIGEAGQQKLKDARVLVVGAGGLGCPVLQYLTAAGVGMLCVMDDREVDMRNLQRQVFYSFNDIGKQKVIVAGSRIRKMNPLTGITLISQRLSYSNALSIVPDYDIVIDCTDNRPSRYVINDACIIAGKPMVHGAIHKFEGQVSVFNFQEGPSYRCLHREDQERGGTDTGESGIYSVIPGIIGLMQTNETIKLITGAGVPLSGKLMVFNAFENQYIYIDLQKNTENFNLEKLAIPFKQNHTS